MKFPNLVWAIAERRLAHYEVAAQAGMSDSRFSRGLNGRTEFTPREKERVAEVLGFDAGWLFQRITPPRPTSSPAEHVAAPVVCASQEEQ